MKYSEIAKELKKTKGHADQVTIENHAKTELADKLYFTGYSVALSGLVVTLISQGIRWFGSKTISEKDFLNAYKAEYERRNETEKSEE